MMKHVGKTILSTLTVTLMMLIVVSLGPAKAETVDTGDYGLVVGGVPVTSENKDDIFHDGKAKFDPVSGTLTLDSPTLREDLASAIYADNLDLVIEGDVRAVGTSYGIQVNNGSLTISSGTIYAAGETAISCYDLVIDNGNITAVNSTDQYRMAAVSAVNNITIRGGEISVTATGPDCHGIRGSNTVSIVSGKITVNTTGTDDGYGISAKNLLSIGGGDVNVTVKASGATMTNAYGLYTIEDIKISGGTVNVSVINDYDVTGLSGNVDISNGTVTVNADGYYAYGLDVYGLTLSGGKLQITARGGENSDCINTDGTVTITGGELIADCTSKAAGAIDAETSITISGGKVTATVSGERASAITCWSYWHTSDQKFVISGGDITATASGTGSLGIFASIPLTISGGTVKASGASYGIYAEGGISIGNDIRSVTAGGQEYAIRTENGEITLGDELIIKEPLGGVLGNNNTTIKKSNNEIATYAVIVNQDPYRITVIENENGTVTANKTKANAGDVITLSVSAAEGYKLTSVTVQDSGGNTVPVTETDDGYQFTMPESDVTVNTTFIRCYAITVSEESEDFINVEPKSAEAGEKVTVTEKEVEGYVIKGITVTDAEGSTVPVTETENGYEFLMPESDVTVTATFARFYTITVSEGSEGLIEIEQKTAEAGEEITVVVNETDGYVTKVIVTDADGNAVDVSDDNTFVMPASDVTVSAKAVKLFTITFDLTGGKLEGKTGTITMVLEEDTVITLGKPVKEGYEFQYWKGSRYYAGEKYKVSEDHTLKAVWKAASPQPGPDTGDHSLLPLYLCLFTASLAGIIGILIWNRKAYSK